MKNHAKFFKNKRGIEQEVYFTILESVLVIVVIIAMLQWVNSIAKDESFEKMALSRDLALTINTIQYSDGDLEYWYYNQNIDMAKFNYRFEDNSVQILDPEKPLVTSYPFSMNKFIPGSIPTTLTKPKSINFEIKND